MEDQKGVRELFLRTAYVRFFRAFNFDYLQKQHPGADPKPWEELADGTSYPYVSVDIDRELTCVVGANESGKSQLLSAIRCALGLRPVTPADFCRYSHYFTVSEEMRIPDFGLEFDSLTDSEKAKISELAGIEDPSKVNSFKFFRTGIGRVSIYVGNDETELGDADELTDLLPTAFSIDPKLALPDSVPISYLASNVRGEFSQIGPRRIDRWRLVDAVSDRARSLFKQLDNPQMLGETLQAAIKPKGPPAVPSNDEQLAYEGRLKLAFDMLISVGGIKSTAFTQLRAALRSGNEGLVSGIIARMNAQLEFSLNLAKWWSQDPQFRLAIDAHDYDIVFTIRDRTGSQYSFRERSSGLKYFLSYLVQVLLRTKNRRGSELLLMDEPDAYLSNQGQQDLLKILQRYALPSEEGNHGQVVFVTHSPFMIDKNYSHRVRVLDKGIRDEGVRIVRDAGRNHFEPLRTSLGGYVGETAFIGNCNLMVEGDADQTFLAGMSRLLSNRDDVAFTNRLDLNDVTLVSAGGASQLPYMVFLARGRDEDKPAVIALLDGDKDGEEAATDLSTRGRYKKQLVKDEYVTTLTKEIPGVVSERPCKGLEMEDLVPIAIAAHAVREYLEELAIEAPDRAVNEDAMREALSEEVGVLDAAQYLLDQHEVRVGITKLGFARHAVDICRSGEAGEEPTNTMCNSFAALFGHLTIKQRSAQRDRERESIASRVDRELRVFLRDSMKSPTKADVSVLLERIAAHIDLSVEGDSIAVAIRRLRHDFKLDQDPYEQITDIESLRSRFEELKYSERMASQK